MQDRKLFRSALLLAGFFDKSESTIFNDRHKDGSRRLKLWFAEQVFAAPQEQQQALEQYLREAFGDRIRSMYFSNGSRWQHKWKALCIQLKD